MRIGIDVGGTHTDAVLLDGEHILASNKSLTSPDVADGIINALTKLLADSGVKKASIKAVMIGTTQFTNAVVERREISKVGIIRLSLPCGKGCPPLTDWPQELADTIGSHVYECHGGYLYDGYPVADIDESEIELAIDSILDANIKVIAVSSAFSIMNPSPELLVEEKIIARNADVKVTMSHKIGSFGLLERENAAILNASLLPFADRVVNAFQRALKEQGFNCPMFISQNDGTLMNADFVRDYPALTFASGPTNSLRGAYKLTGIENAIVVDIGGTTSDIGVLQQGFPRESNVVIDVGGVRTNFRMPDIKALGLGGGSHVSNDGLCIGPISCGHNLVNDGKVFGGQTLTATDIAVALGQADIGDKSLIADLPADMLNKARQTMLTMLDSNIEMMKPNAKPAPVILVGGGAVLIESGLQTASQLIRPENAGVANAIGAAIAQVGGESESLQSYASIGREHAIQKVTEEAKVRATAAGAKTDSLRVIDVEETDVPYMNDGMTRVRVKVLGELA